MATNEFQTRALYDFIAENPNELSFYSGEILIITSATEGQPWWYARNSAGQQGVIPANYIELLTDTSEPSVDSNAYDYTNDDPNSSANNQSTVQTNYDPNSSTFTQSTVQTNYEQPQQQYTNSTDEINWFSDEPVSQLPDQQNLLTEREISLDSSFDSSAYENSGYASQQTSDPFAAGSDMPIPLESLPTSVINPFVVHNETSNQQDSWYANYTAPATTTLPENPPPPPSTNLLSPFGYSQPPIPQQPPQQQQQQPQYQPPQQNTFTNNFTFPPSITQNDHVYEPPPTFSSPSNVTVHTPVPVSPPANDLMSLASPTSPIPQKNVENTAVSSSPKSKQEKSGLFTLRRQKTKNEPEKRPSLIENRSEPPSQSTKNDSDSDDFTRSTSSAHNTLSGKSSIAAGDSKAATKARFFDKHGVDNYLLHGCKIKADERVEIAYDEKDGGVHWLNNPNIPPFSCKVDDPAKGTKLGGLKSFMEYKIHAQIPGSRVVGRRYKQFDWLHEQLVNKYRFICVPPLPGKQIAGRFENEFVEERRRQLELWLNRVCRHPVLCASFPVQHFVTCELTEKNNKDWKAGKRRSEKDELREASWLHCVTFTNSILTETQIASQVDVFAQQQPGLETHLRNLNQGLTKYLERHTEIYERDMQRLGELFSKLFMAMQIDTLTPGNKELANCLSKIGVAFNGIGELYKTKSSEGIRDFNERILDYIGIISCFPLILTIQRSASEFIRTVQQRGSTGTPDYAGVLNRSQVLNHVVLAEINFFQREKVFDFNTYLKQLLHEQIQFYENVTTELRQVEATFN